MTTYTPRYGLPKIDPVTDLIKATGTPSALAADINRLADRSEVALSGVDEKAASSVSTALNAKQAADAASARNLLQDLLLAQNDLRLRTLEAIGSLGPGSVTDGTIAATVNNDESLTHEALESAFVKRGTLVHDVRDYGAKGDNVTDDSVAFTAAIAAAKATRGRAIAYGTFRLNQPIMVDANADFGDCVVNYYGSGTAFTVSGTRLKVNTPRELWNGLKANGGGWDSVVGSIGVRLHNTNGCDIRVPFVSNFEEGLSCFGSNGGCAYNTVHLGWLFNNKRNQVLDTYSSTSTGYTNQNTFIGGRFSHHAAEGVALAGVFSLFTTGAGDGGPNNNVWLNPCLEGAGAQYAWNFERARFSKIINARVEFSTGARFGAGALNNEISIGYYSTEFPIVRESGSATNDVIFASNRNFYNKNDSYYGNNELLPWLSFIWGSRKVTLTNGSTGGASLSAGNGFFTCEGHIRPDATNLRDLGSSTLSWRTAFIGRVTAGSGLDLVSATNAPAAPGMARLFGRTVAGKVQVCVQFPSGGVKVLSAED